jgi:hypothetical protein
MRKKIVKISLLMTLLAGASIFALSLIFVVAIGVLIGLFIEMFKLHSRISNLELKSYKIARPVEKDVLILKSKKIFKLPLPEKVRSNGVFMAPMNEKKLSEAR